VGKKEGYHVHLFFLTDELCEGVFQQAGKVMVKTTQA
jgi:hypothetical protein